MTTPMASSDATLVAKYGYAMKVSPAANCGQRCCFFPYTNRTNPTPPMMSDKNSHAGSRDMMQEPNQRYRTSSIGKPCRWSRSLEAEVRHTEHTATLPLLATALG